MRKNDKRLQEDITRRDFIADDSNYHQLPSRMELHRKKKRQSKEEEKKQKKFKLSIPLVLLIILLMLPISIYYIGNIEKKTNAHQVQSPGEEIYDSVDPPKSNIGTIDPEVKDVPSGPVVIDDPVIEDDEAVDEDPIQEEVTDVEDKTEEEKEEPIKEKEDVVEEKFVFHTVQKGETLFKISMEYFNGQQGIELIKQANGIVGNEINAGVTLKIPLP